MGARLSTAPPDSLPDSVEPDHATAGATVVRFWANSVPVVALALGAALRIQQFASRRSLWLDEANLAINIVGRSYAGLLQPLELHQAAPVGFLWIQRFCVTVFGNNEYALRLFPLLSGLVALLLFHRLARRIVSPGTAPVATILFAMSPLVISYSNEVKQYSSDVMAALLVLNVGHALLHAPRITARSAVGFAALGAGVVWISHPAVLVLAGVGATVVAVRVCARRWGDAARLAAACSAWTVSLVATWSIARRTIELEPGFIDFWADGFPPVVASIGDIARWLGTRGHGLMTSPMGLSLTGLGLIVCGIGSAALLRRRRGLDVALLCSAIPFAVAAALMRVYPLAGRLALFLVPTAVILLAASVDWTVGRRRRLRALAAAALSVPLLVVSVNPVRAAWKAFETPPVLNEARPVLEHVRGDWRVGDALYVHWAAHAAFRYYGPTMGLKADGLIGNRKQIPCDPAGRLAALKDARRVWVVFAHQMSSMPVNEREIVRSFVAVVAKPVSGFIAHGAAAYLFDPQARPPDPLGEHVIIDPRVTCISIHPV